jgi:hypothetical protein
MFEQTEWTIEELGADAEKMNGFVTKDFTDATCNGGKVRKMCEDMVLHNSMESTHMTANKAHIDYSESSY